MSARSLILCLMLYVSPAKTARIQQKTLADALRLHGLGGSAGDATSGSAVYSWIRSFVHAEPSANDYNDDNNTNDNNGTLQEQSTTMTTTTPVAVCLESMYQRKEVAETGYLHAAPALYKDAFGFKGCVKDPLDFTEYRNTYGYAPMLLGGGELPHNVTSLLGRHAGPVVFWGISAPMFDGSDKSLPSFARQGHVKLVGIRDYVNAGHHERGSKIRWVPDASAMHSEFDQYFRKKPGVGVLVPTDESSGFKRKYAYVRNVNDGESSNCEQQAKRWIENGDLEHHSIMDSNYTLKNLLHFMAHSEAVVSDSYHVLYWAGLLGRKRIYCGEPKQMWRLKHSRWPVTKYSGNISADFDAAETFPEAMEQARTANMNFAKEVQRVLKLEETPRQPSHV